MWADPSRDAPWYLEDQLLSWDVVCLGELHHVEGTAAARGHIERGAHVDLHVHLQCTSRVPSNTRRVYAEREQPRCNGVSSLCLPVARELRG